VINLIEREQADVAAKVVAARAESDPTLWRLNGSGDRCVRYDTWCAAQRLLSAGGTRRDSRTFVNDKGPACCAVWEEDFERPYPSLLLSILSDFRYTLVA